MADTTPDATGGRTARSTSRPDILHQRLDDGYRRIEEALRDGADVSHWEAFWVELLHEYEALCDERREAA